MSYPDLKTEAQYRAEIAVVWGILEAERAAFKRLQAQLEAARRDAVRHAKDDVGDLSRIDRNLLPWSQRNALGNVMNNMYTIIERDAALEATTPETGPT